MVPTLYLCSDAAAAGLAAFVRAGGHALISYFSGIVDESDHVRLGGYPGAFRELLGVRVEEFAPLLAGTAVTLDDGSRADLWTELLDARESEVLVRYRDGPLPGTPALTRRPVGDGVAWYIGTRLDEAGTAALAGRLSEEAGVRRLEHPRPGLELVRRMHEGGSSYLFALNSAAEPVTVAARGVDLLSGAHADGTLTVPAGQVVVLREEQG